MLLSNLNLLSQAPGGVARLRELVLTLAVQGKLVPQDPKDEPASELLKQIRAEKDRLIADGKIKRDKPQAEIADEEKPFGLPPGWEWSNLATIGIINPRNDAPDETIASFVEMRSIPAAFSAEHATESRPWRDIKSGFTQFAESDVGVAKITPCFENGKSTVFQNLSNGIGAGTTELHIVRPLGGIAPKYVLLFLKTPAFLLNGEAVMTGSAGQKRMPRDYFERTPFPLPPLAEQSRIVTRVEELMRLCDALEAKGQREATQHAQLVSTLLATLADSETPAQLADNWHRIATHFDLLLDRSEAVDALEQTILQLAVRGLLVPQDPHDEPASALLKKIRAEKDKLIAEGKIKRDKPLPPIAEHERPFALPLGWEWVRLGDIGYTNIGLTYSPNDVSETGTPVLRSNNVQAGKLDLSDLKRVNMRVKESVLVAEGDLLICARNGSKALVGKTALITGITEPMAFGAFMAIFRSDVNGYVLHFINSQLFRRMISDVNTTTINQITQENLRGTIFPMPPLAEQSRIVTRVAQLRRLCADLRQRLSASQSTQAHLAEALVADPT